jgi:hypothetical protein
MATDFEDFLQTWNSTTTAAATKATARATLAQAQMIYDALSPEAKARVDAATAERDKVVRKEQNRRTLAFWGTAAIFAVIYLVHMILVG